MLVLKYFFIFLFLISSLVNAQQKKIAFCSNQGSSGFLQIFIMNEDGSDIKQITDIEENCMRPRWSSDGKQVVFYSDRGFIYLIRDVNATSTVPFYLWNGYNPSFMPQGDQIMFNNEVNDVLSILVIDTAAFGSEPALVSDGRYSNMQVLSNNGKDLIFSAFDEDTKTIMMADLEDSTDSYISKISNNEEANLEPDISPDDKKIVYSSFDNNLKGTIIVNENGTEIPLTKGLPSSNVPRFSPDGNKIAFVVIDQQVNLYVMNQTGSEKKRLNISEGSVGTFQWIDNNRIIYDAGSDTRTSIGIININTGDNNIIAEGGFNLHPNIQK